MREKKPCPEFPFFGATYPDARCIDGRLWDMDSCDDNDRLTVGGEAPCPFCNKNEFIEYYGKSIYRFIIERYSK